MTRKQRSLVARAVALFRDGADVPLHADGEPCAAGRRTGDVCP
jgi:hypothetical protein